MEKQTGYIVQKQYRTAVEVSSAEYVSPPLA
jgi:hypothetical protein